MRREDGDIKKLEGSRRDSWEVRRNSKISVRYFPLTEEDVAMVFEKLGCNMLTLIRMYKYRGLPLPLVRMITKQMVIAMEFLHRCCIIHTDLKPENSNFSYLPSFFPTPSFIVCMSPKFISFPPFTDSKPKIVSLLSSLLFLKSIART
jgi:serine/threonine protein kinase